MVKVSEFPDDERQAYLDRDMPSFDETPFVKGKPLSERRIALISTAGLHRRGDRLFTEESGDYRIIPGDVDEADLVMSHVSTNFDRIGFMQDVNVAMPFDRLRELVAEGYVGSMADYHFSFMGATPPEKMAPSVRELVDILQKDEVDTVMLCPV